MMSSLAASEPMTWNLPTLPQHAQVLIIFVKWISYGICCCGCHSMANDKKSSFFHSFGRSKRKHDVCRTSNAFWFIACLVFIQYDVMREMAKQGEFSREKRKKKIIKKNKILNKLFAFYSVTQWVVSSGSRHSYDNFLHSMRFKSFSFSSSKTAVYCLS